MRRQLYARQAFGALADPPRPRMPPGMLVVGEIFGYARADDKVSPLYG